MFSIEKNPSADTQRPFWDLRTACLILSILMGVISIFPGTPNFAQEIESVQKGTKFVPTSVVEDKLEEGDMTEPDRLTEQEGRYLLALARKTIEQRIFGLEAKDEDVSQESKRFSERRGTFVTLTIEGGLRGCIGNIIPQETLIEGVKANAISAAFRDPRFRPISRKEWERVKVEISILTDPRPLDYSDKDDLLEKLRPGIDGVIIKKGYHQSTFLPQVWEQLPDKKEFLNHLCLKAGLDGDEWRKERLEVLTYQVQAFEE